MEQDLTPRLIKELRGDRDYKSISEEVGISYGQFFKLENGYSKLKFEEFIKICQTVKSLDLKKIFKNIMCLELEEFTQAEFMERYCSSWGEPSKYVLKEKLGFTPSKWWRLKTGQSRLTFDDFIKLITSCGCDAYGFLSHFLPEDVISLYTKKENDFFENEMRIMAAFPEACQITTIIGDNSYVNADVDNKTDLLRSLSKLDHDKFNFLLNILVKNNVLYLNKENGLYEKHQMKIYLKDQNIDTYETMKSISKFAMNSQERVMSDPEHDRDRIKFAFGVSTLTREAFNEIRQEIIDSFHRINTILENDNLKDNPQMELAIFQMGIHFIEEDFSKSKKSEI